MIQDYPKIHTKLLKWQIPDDTVNSEQLKIFESSNFFDFKDFLMNKSENLNIEEIVYCSSVTVSSGI